MRTIPWSVTYILVQLFQNSLLNKLGAACDKVQGNLLPWAAKNFSMQQGHRWGSAVSDWGESQWNFGGKLWNRESWPTILPSKPIQVTFELSFLLLSQRKLICACNRGTILSTTRETNSAVRRLCGFTSILKSQIFHTWLLTWKEKHAKNSNQNSPSLITDFSFCPWFLQQTGYEAAHSETALQSQAKGFRYHLFLFLLLLCLMLQITNRSKPTVTVLKKMPHFPGFKAMP